MRADQSGNFVALPSNRAAFCAVEHWAGSPEPAPLVLLGPSGTGKTLLVDRAVAAVRARGTAAVRASFAAVREQAVAARRAVAPPHAALAVEHVEDAWPSARAWRSRVFEPLMNAGVRLLLTATVDDRNAADVGELVRGLLPRPPVVTALGLLCAAEQVELARAYAGQAAAEAVARAPAAWARTPAQVVALIRALQVEREHR